MKVCSKCKRALKEAEFNWKIKGVKRSYHCKTCSREYLKNHYTHNREYYLIKARKRDLIIKRQCQEFIAQHLLSHPCVDCGENDIQVLEFDHKDKSNKSYDVAVMIRRGIPFKKVVSEIEKCDVRCANCHRRKTGIEINSWKLKYAPVA